MQHFNERFVLTNMDATPAVKQNDAREKILKTKYLFLNLLRMFRPGLILDVGSMDGSDSMRFRRMSPQSKIIAFEANPYNYAKMQSNPHLAQMNIEVRNRLVSSKAEKGKFYISKGAISLSFPSHISHTDIRSCSDFLFRGLLLSLSLVCF